ncbi:Uncharacterised protein [Capnocytophaga canimorsus]|nr:Uncharacterised protein [Capnocytophaga canimorsus]
MCIYKDSQNKNKILINNNIYINIDYKTYYTERFLYLFNDTLDFFSSLVKILLIRLFVKKSKESLV